MRNEIIGPLSPEEKAEIREILIGMGEPIEPRGLWNMFNNDERDIPLLARFNMMWEVIMVDYPLPTITFEDFKKQYVK